MPLANSTFNNRAAHSGCWCVVSVRRRPRSSYNMFIFIKLRQWRRGREHLGLPPVLACWKSFFLSDNFLRKKHIPEKSSQFYPQIEKTWQNYKQSKVVGLSECILKYNSSCGHWSPVSCVNKVGGTESCNFPADSWKFRTAKL